MRFLKTKILFTLLTSLLFNNLSSAYAQTNSIQTGSTNKLKISLQNEIGVRTTANVNGDAIVTNTAELELEPGSKITDSFSSEDDPGVSGEFIVTPTGSTFNLTGLVAENEYIIQKADFSSEITNIDPLTGELIDTGQPANGNASASLFTNMVLDVEQTNSSFTTTFSSNF